MPSHYGGNPEKKATERRKEKSIERRIMNGGKKKKPMKMFEKQPPNTHMMADGIIMSGSKHTKDSKVVGKLKKARKGTTMKKGSKAMKEKMARLRAMRKK